MSSLVGLVAVVPTTLILARLAGARGRGDFGRGAERARKLQAVAVPAVGGLAVLLAWHLVFWFDSSALARATPAVVGEGTRRALLVLLAFDLAFLVGLVDDRRTAGLSPAAKVAGQLLAGALIGLGLGAATLGAVLLHALGAALACNLVNTFDNADGAAASVTGAGLAAAASPLAGAVLGFAAVQLAVRRGPRRDAVAYLGDAGSHLLGVALLADPVTWPALFVPALDLARVAGLRLRAGQAPWRGDRRHLAHRLQRRGLGSRAVVAVLLVLAAPALLLPIPLGFALSAALFCAALALSRELIPPAPCPDEAPSR